MSQEFMRRSHAGKYLKEKYGFGSAALLAKLASLGGGPKMAYAGDIPLYTKEWIDEWALARIGQPVHSTSEHKALLEREVA
jgi:hypothetical protein